MSASFLFGFIVGHAIGFIFGAILACFMLRWLENFLLKNPTTSVTASDVRRWVENNQQIKELSSLTRVSLDKISGHV